MNLKELRELLANAPDDMDLDDLLPKKEVIKVINPEMASEIPVDDSGCLSFRHSVNSGDLIAAMGSFKKYYEMTHRKCIVMQKLNLQAQYYQGATHPVVDENGKEVTMNQKMWEMMKPLMESQEYIQRFETYAGQKIDVDLDVIRGKTFVNMPHGPIQGWIKFAFPDLSFDISKPWIILDDNCPAAIRGQAAGKVILNFTDRYRDTLLDYYFLKNYSPDLIFAGTEKEYWNFCNRFQLSIPRLEVNDFLELAYAINVARFTFCNQSMVWNLCQSMGKPRVLEMCRFADNCFPNIGENSEGFFYQLGAEYSFRTMYNQTVGK